MGQNKSLTALAIYDFLLIIQFFVRVLRIIPGRLKDAVSWRFFKNFPAIFAIWFVYIIDKE